MIRGLYFISADLDTITPASLEDGGLSDLFFQVTGEDGQDISLHNYDATYRELINSILGLTETTSINLRLCPPPFKDAEGNHANPSSETYTMGVCNGIRDILTDHPEIKGVSFDDYVIDSSIYNVGLLNQQQNELVNYTETVGEVVRECGGDYSAAMYWADYRSTDISQIAPYFDFLIPEIYNWNYGAVSWLKSTITSYQAHAGRTPVVVALATYVSNTNQAPYSNAKLRVDARNALMKCQGYAFYRYDHSPNDLTFPISARDPGINRKGVSRV